MMPYQKFTAAALFGLTVGGILLWIVVRKIDPQQLSLAVTTMDVASVAGALVCYWIAITMRIARWLSLLRQLGPVRTAQVAESLIIGYAVNNVLPARLGELFRADYAKRRVGLSRTMILGSILIERLLDLCVILLCLIVGLALTDFHGKSDPQIDFEMVAVSASLLIAVVIVGIYWLRSGKLWTVRLPAFVACRVDDLRRGISSLNRASAMHTIVLSVGVWVFELLALWWIFHALTVNLAINQTLLLMGAASLSTLVPTAPGYIGTYQLVFVISMGLFGFSDAHGVVAATSIQVVFFGSIILVGIVLYIARSFARLRLAQ